MLCRLPAQVISFSVKMENETAFGSDAGGRVMGWDRFGIFPLGLASEGSSGKMG